MPLNIPTKKTGDTLSAEELNSIVSEINKKEDSIVGKGLSSNDYTNDEKQKLTGLPVQVYSKTEVYSKGETYSKEEVDGKVVARPLVLSLSESKSGTYDIGGEKLDIWERSVQLPSLPQNADETKEYIISDEPLGFGTYLDVDSFVASTGRGLNKEFFNHNYDIVRLYINSQLQSCIVVRCKNTVTEDVNGLLHIRYCKFYGDIVEFDVAFPNTIDKESVSLSIPPLKFNKKMVFSYITDDSNTIYQYIFSLINKRKLAKKMQLPDGRYPYYHLGMQGKQEFEQYVSDDYYPDNFAQCTDGTGVKRRYATAMAMWPEKLKDQSIGQDVGMWYPWVSEKEFKMYRDFGYMAILHDLVGYSSDTDTQEKFDKCLNDTISFFNEYAGITPKVMAEPNGDHNYIAFSRNNPVIQAITAQSGDSSIQLVYPFKSDFTLDKNDVTIQRVFAYGNDLTLDNDTPEYAQNLLSRLATMNSSADRDSIYWLIGSAHRCAHWESVLIKNIHQLYGDIGNDSLWFPTLDEFFEYWYMRVNTLSVKTITDTGVHFKMYIPKGSNFFYRDLSVLLDGISSVEGVSVVSGENVYGTSYAVSDGKLLVNLNFDEKLMQRVDKYVSAFEADHNKEYAYDDAYYFVQQLKNGLIEPYLQRLNQFVSPPTLESLKINNGSSTTGQKIVTLSITYSGQAPTHYMASENSDFSGSVWVEYSDNPSFILSDGFNEKTVYVKLKNTHGESTAKSNSITYIETVLTLNSIMINGGTSSTSQGDVSVAFTYTGNPTHYMLSEDSDFSGALWTAFNNSTVLFSLSEGYGNKTVYAKMKDVKNETSVKSAQIQFVDTVSVRLNSIVINNGDAGTNSGTVSVTFDTVNQVTRYKIGKQPDLSDCPEWLDWSNSPVQFEAGVTEGNLMVYAQVGNATTVSEIKSDSIQVTRPVVVSIKAVIGFNGALNNKVDYITSNGDTINQVRLATHTGYDTLQLKDSQGGILSSWYFNCNSYKYSPNEIFPNGGTNNYESNSTADDSGIYPAEIFLKCQSCQNNASDGTKKLRLSFFLPAGHYRARILNSPADNFVLEEKYRVNSFYGVFQGNSQLAKVNVGEAGFTGKGNNQYNNELEFTVDQNSDVDFAAWQEGTPTQSYRPGINLIELTKLS